MSSRLTTKAEGLSLGFAWRGYGKETGDSLEPFALPFKQFSSVLLALN